MTLRDALNLAVPVVVAEGVSVRCATSLPDGYYLALETLPDSVVRVRRGRGADGWQEAVGLNVEWESR